MPEDAPSGIENWLAKNKYDVLYNNIKSTASDVWLPSVAAMAGTGGLAAYMTSKQKPRRGEDEAARRKRIIQNGLLASTLTGGAIAGGVGGYHLLNHDPTTAAPIDFLGDLFGIGGEVMTEQEAITPAAAAAGALAGRHFDDKKFNKNIKSRFKSSLIAAGLDPSGDLDIRTLPPSKLAEIAKRRADEIAIEKGFANKPIKVHYEAAIAELKGAGINVRPENVHAYDNSGHYADENLKPAPDKVSVGRRLMGGSGRKFLGGRSIIGGLVGSALGYHGGGVVENVKESLPGRHQP